MRPTSVASGEEALHSLARAAQSGAPFPIVLSDVQMPVMDGFQFARIVHENPALGAPMVLLLSSTGQIGEAVRAKVSGVAACLTKPIRRAELHAALNAVIHIIRKTEPSLPV
jgi:two-component system sensor histidine kinase/response regulator